MLLLFRSRSLLTLSSTHEKETAVINSLASDEKVEEIPHATECTFGASGFPSQPEAVASLSQVVERESCNSTAPSDGKHSITRVGKGHDSMN